MITDGNAEVPDQYVRKVNLWKDEKKIDWNSFCLGSKSKNLQLFSDRVTLVDIEDDASSSELFQDVLL